VAAAREELASIRKRRAAIDVRRRQLALQTAKLKESRGGVSLSYLWEPRSRNTSVAAFSEISEDFNNERSDDDDEEEGRDDNDGERVVAAALRRLVVSQNTVGCVSEWSCLAKAVVSHNIAAPCLGAPGWAC
jgi:hypothetical protein